MENKKAKKKLTSANGKKETGAKKRAPLKRVRTKLPKTAAANSKVRTDVMAKRSQRPAHKLTQNPIQKQSRGIGYFTISSVLMGVGLLFAIQTELNDEMTISAAAPASRSLSSSVFEKNPEPVQANVVRPPTDPTPSPSPIPEINSSVKSVPSIPLLEEFKLASPLDSAERIKFWSFYIQESKEHRDNVAELANGFTIEDVAPIVPRKYDCTTFVETVAALSRSNSPDQFIANLVAIRYKNGTSNFYSRNHLPEIDWIPNNQKSGVLKDITREVAQSFGLKAKVSKKKIDRKKWIAARAREEGFSLKSEPLGEKLYQASIHARVPYIRLDQLKEVIEKIPDGTVINLVHEGSKKHAGIITHQGFLIRDGDQLFLRHASIGGRIRSSKFFDYIAKLQREKTRWPVVGVNLNQFSDSSSSKSRLSDTM